MKSDTERQTSYDSAYRWIPKKRGIDELIYKTELESQMQKTNLWLPWNKWGGTNWETGVDMYTLLYIKQITNKNLPHNTSNSAEYCVMAYIGKES